MLIKVFAYKYHKVRYSFYFLQLIEEKYFLILYE